MPRKIIPYSPHLKEYARYLRNNSTKSEIRLWLQIKGKQMNGYDFHRQKPLLRFIADFYCYELNLVIELDGALHLSEEVQQKDAIKEAELNRIGLTVMRFKDEEVFDNMEGVIMKIKQYIIDFEAEEY